MFAIGDCSTIQYEKLVDYIDVLLHEVETDGGLTLEELRSMLKLNELRYFL